MIVITNKGFGSVQKLELGRLTELCTCCLQRIENVPSMVLLLQLRQLFKAFISCVPIESIYF